MAELRFVPLNEIKVGKRAREEYGDITELANSIRAKGVIQPITLDKDLNLIAGGRRVRAAREAGLTEIPALIRDMDTTLGEEIDAKEVELIENIARLDMTWQEKAKLRAEIHELYIRKHGGHSHRTDLGGWSGSKTAELVGISPMEMSRSLKMAQALKAMPELENCKTEKEAFDRLKKLEEAVLIKMIREKQQADPGVSNLERYAASHYRIGDAIKGMEELANTEWVGASFIEVDPPYGIDLNEVKRRQGKFNPDIDGYTEIEREQYPAFLERVAILTYACAAPNAWMIFWYGPTWHGTVLDALRGAGWKVDDIPGIWCKGTGQTNAPEVHLARTYEPFFICRKGQPVLRERGKANVFHYKPVPADRKYHPTERPLDLMIDLVGTFAYPGSIMLVPFLGSGVTLRAGYYHDVKGFGWDLNEDTRDRFLLRVKEDDEKLRKMRGQGNGSENAGASV